MKKNAREILVVDDNADLREWALTTLQNNGYAAVAVNSGLEAIKYLEERDLPGLVLLDLEMPVMNGREFVAALSENERWRSIPIVLWSAKREVATIARELGVAGVLEKPGTCAQFVSTVRRLL